MSIFGQVWLWSIAAFVVGALFTWVLLVRPAQKKIAELERRMTYAEPVAARNGDHYGGETQQPLMDDQHAPASTQTLPPAEAHPGPSSAAQGDANAGPGWFDQDSFAAAGSQPAAAHREDADLSAGVAAMPESAAQTEEDSGESSPGSLFLDGRDAEPQEGPGRPAEAETTQILPKRQPKQPIQGGFDPPAPIQPSMRSVERRAPADSGGNVQGGSLFEPTEPNRDSGECPPSDAERTMESASQNTGAQTAHRESPAVPGESAIPGETVIETGQQPNAETDSVASEMDTVPPGPFGPGSAMPKPGGGAPSAEFAVKASVTALRYCTDESPQFPRMVAEVWFRTVADAEKVGFRPLA